MFTFSRFLPNKGRTEEVKGGLRRKKKRVMDKEKTRENREEKRQRERRKEICNAFERTEYIFEDKSKTVKEVT